MMPLDPPASPPVLNDERAESEADRAASAAVSQGQQPVFVSQNGAGTRTPAYCVDERQGCYAFSVLGNDTQLYNRPQAETDPTHIAGELNLPTPIRLRHFERRKTDCQLSANCAEEITRGAEDESDWVCFTISINLNAAPTCAARLDDYTPAGMDAGIIYAT